MGILKVKLTEDMIKLISNIRFKEVPDMDKECEVLTWGLDFFNLYGETTTFEEIAYILGLYDKRIKDTEESPLGAKFPEDISNYLWETHSYIVDNIGSIEEILHQFAGKGGLTPGDYQCKSHERIWEKIS